MNRTTTILILLFMLLITGAFASMAQNNYGFLLIGFVCMCYAAFFLYHLIRKLTAGKKSSLRSRVELLALFLLAFSFGLNVFHIRVPFLSYITVAAAVMLILIYASYLREALVPGKTHVWNALYYTGIELFLLTMIMSQLNLQIPFYIEILGFGCLVACLVGMLVIPALREGLRLQRLTDVMAGFRNRSFLVASIFFITFIYGSAVSAGALPPLYADDYPKVFYELTGKKDEADRRAQTSPRDFKDAFERFVSRNIQ
jgi:hypothetical protein